MIRNCVLLQLRYAFSILVINFFFVCEISKRRYVEEHSQLNLANRPVKLNKAREKTLALAHK